MKKDTKESKFKHNYECFPCKHHIQSDFELAITCKCGRRMVEIDPIEVSRASKFALKGRNTTKIALRGLNVPKTA